MRAPSIYEKPIILSLFEIVTLICSLFILTVLTRSLKLCHWKTDFYISSLNPRL